MICSFTEVQSNLWRYVTFEICLNPQLVPFRPLRSKSFKKVSKFILLVGLLLRFQENLKVYFLFLSSHCCFSTVFFHHRFQTKLKSSIVFLNRHFKPKTHVPTHAGPLHERVRVRHRWPGPQAAHTAWHREILSDSGQLGVHGQPDDGAGGNVYLCPPR